MNDAHYPFPECPPNWTSTIVGEVISDLQPGFSCSRHNQAGEGIPHLRPMNVSPDGEISLHQVLYVPSDAGTARLVNDDVLFTNTSSTAWVGKTAVVRDAEEWAFSNHMTRLKTAEGVIPEFISQQLHYLCLSGYFAIHCTKHINQSSVSSKQLLDVPIRLAPTSEQIQIASKLSFLLSRERKVRHALESLLSLIDECRTSVLGAACRGELVPNETKLSGTTKRSSDITKYLTKILDVRRRQWQQEQLSRFAAIGKNPVNDRWSNRYKEPVSPSQELSFEVPPGWALVSVDHCGLVQLGKMRSPKNRPRDFARRYIRAANITEQGLDLSNLMEMDFPPGEFEQYQLKKGDLVLAEASGSPQQVGKPALWSGAITDCCYQNTVIRLRPTQVTPEFLLIVFQYMYRSGAFAQTASGAGINHLSAERFIRMPLALPPLTEQRQIVIEVRRRMHTLDKMGSTMQLALKDLSHLRQSLYYQAFSGQLVESMSESESAVALLEQLRSSRASRSEEEKRKRQARVRAKKKKELATMKSLEEISQTHLGEILDHQKRPLSARELWKASELTIDDFYAQLKVEMGKTLQETEQRMLEIRK